jgi:hypothetical protein
MLTTFLGRFTLHINIYPTSLANVQGERGPEGWREMVDPECLDIASRSLCVYGQLYGGYAAGVAALGLVSFEEAQRCGFTSRAGGYAERTDAWKAYLRGVTKA